MSVQEKAVFVEGDTDKQWRKGITPVSALKPISCMCFNEYASTPRTGIYWSYR